MREEFGTDTIARQAATIHRVVGPTILLGSGTYYDFESPSTSRLTLEDVAYGLGFECRFNGQCVHRRTKRRVFYSVAEHCVRMSYLVPPGYEYDALMHEVGEVTCGDMNAPLKSLCPDYKTVEKRCETAGLLQFRVPMKDKQLIKEYDIVMLAWERRDLLPWTGEKWSFEPAHPVPEADIEPWGPHEAAEAFILRFKEVAPPEVLDLFV